MATFPKLVFGTVETVPDDTAATAAAAGAAPTPADGFANTLGPEFVTAPGPPPIDASASAAYHAQHPEPNYSEFEAEMVDQYGREYSVARAGRFLEAQEDLANDLFVLPSGQPGGASKRWGRLLLFSRMPIKHRGEVALPEADGQKLQLYFPRTQVLCHATTDGSFFQPRARTGHVFVKNFVVGAKVTDPSRFEEWVEGGSREPGMRRF